MLFLIAIAGYVWWASDKAAEEEARHERQFQIDGILLNAHLKETRQITGESIFANEADNLARAAQ